MTDPHDNPPMLLAFLKQIMALWKIYEGALLSPVRSRHHALSWLPARRRLGSSRRRRRFRRVRGRWWVHPTQSSIPPYDRFPYCREWL